MAGRGLAVLTAGVLSSLVTVALLVPLPRGAQLLTVGGLVAALAVLAGVSGAWRTVATWQVLWFWGVVTGVGHLLRALVAAPGAEPAGVASVVVGAASTVVLVACLALLYRARRG